MSLVGTRPILQDELQKYELHHRARIAIKPGITGMWQVSGRSDITDFEEVVRLDTEYSQKEGTLWVEDHGTGMNENELSNYLFKTANSGYKYMKKREFMFPAIAKFGIGFVACLTKADKIQILTRTQSDNGISFVSSDHWKQLVSIKRRQSLFIHDIKELPESKLNPADGLRSVIQTVHKLINILSINVRQIICLSVFKIT